jgi:hypothetical protein
MPIAWKNLDEYYRKKTLPPRTPEIQEYMNSVPQIIRQQRQTFLSQIMDLRDTYEEPNPYPFDLDSDIIQIIIWYGASKHPSSCFDPADREFTFLDPSESFVTYTGIKVTCAYLFVWPPKYKFKSKEPPKFFYHQTTVDKLKRIMAVKIEDKTGFLLTDFSMHELGIPRNFTSDYSFVNKGETEPLKRFDVMYNGIYFSPFFEGDKIAMDYDENVVIIINANVVFATKNWHYNYEDIVWFNQTRLDDL